MNMIFAFLNNVSFLQYIVMKIKFKYCWAILQPISTKQTITSGFKLLHISMKTTSYMSFLLVMVGDVWLLTSLSTIFQLYRGS